MDAPQAFGVVGDFSALIAEEAPLLTVLQFSTSSLVFWGAEPPVFRRIFALWPAFQRWVGYLPYPREKSGTQGRQRLLLFSQWWVVCVLQVCFQLQKQISQAPQRFSVFSIRCAPATQQRQKNVFQMQAAPVPHLCHGKRNADSAVGATTFSLLPHLPHIIFTRLPLQ